MKLSELQARLYNCIKKCEYDETVHIKETTSSYREGFKAVVDISANGETIPIIVKCDMELNNLSSAIKLCIEIFREELVCMGFINDLEDTEPQKLMQEAKELLEKESIAPKDNVNHPSHYTQGKIECIEAIESATIGKSGIEAVCVANVIKYLWRYEKKEGIESVEKAMWYLHRLLRVLEEK